jgi:RNA polymerase sigma factor (sigma-70 family)
MATTQLGTFIDHLRQAVVRRDCAGLADAELLQRFVAHRDGATFEALVRRHGPLVFGVCRRVLRDAHDAEDAFQAVFLVLFRKAASLRRPERLGNWLYGVAYRTALEARKAAARRRAREVQVEALPEREAPAEPAWGEVGPLLDDALARLPEKYRVPVLLCDLEGRTRKEVARQLGWPEGTVAGRLVRARRLLARLRARRGLVLPGGLAASLVGRSGAAAVPAPLVWFTARAVQGGAEAAPLPARVIHLAEGVVKAMLITRWKTVAVVVLVLALAGLGAGKLVYPARAGDEPSGGRRQSDPQGAGRGREDRTDLEKLQGGWKLTRVEMDGKQQSPERLRFWVTGNRIAVETKDGYGGESFRLHPGASPKGIDLTGEEGNLTGEEGKRPDYALYKLDGDTLALCMSQDQATNRRQRPAAFTAAKGTGNVVLVFRRCRGGELDRLAASMAARDALVAELGRAMKDMKDKAVDRATRLKVLNQIEEAVRKTREAIVDEKP